MTDDTQKRFVTKDGLVKLEAELKELKTEKRKEIAERIHEAKELGDLSENAEYIEAKEEQGFVESRILELEHIIKNSEIISHSKNTDVVQVGSTVNIQNDAGDSVTYTIVGSSEADPDLFMISNQSPIGKALLGKKVKEHVDIDVPNGVITYEVLSIE